MLQKYQDRFQGIRQAQRDIEIHLPMTENTTPVAQKPRRVPYHLDIIEKVHEHEAIRWCSPLWCNQNQRTPKTFESVWTYDFESIYVTYEACTVFSKVDLNHGYHQFALDEESKRVMTFSTPWGNYRYKRLAFGGVNSQDVFDEEIPKIISGIPHVLNNQDNIMISEAKYMKRKE
ncbi:uncharacterized protein K02A2.6-like [Dendronephthya gigantea]|uniref:uncharacterized protein K02A2.6-like n=1 Tax=Dendronephthya gigantea TaxID=151771 RepID=UPI00106B1FFF|nr:uncharacterized protein K02A2.6-like [Dendronephthya gigantea]